MANTCGLFGDLIPNIYIDKVFLEESHIGTQQDKDGNFTSFLQTPVVSVQLKVLDSISDGGTFSILGDALQIQNSSGTVDFKKYFKVHCMLFTSQEDAEGFITLFEQENYKETTDYFSLPTSFAPARYQITDLNDFTDTYVNADGITEILSDRKAYRFELAQDSVISYLRVFTFVQLDTATLESDLNSLSSTGMQLPDSLKNIIGRYRDQVVIQDSQTVSQLTIFVTEDGDVWDDSFHLMQQPIPINSSTFSTFPVSTTTAFALTTRYMTGRIHQGTPSEQLLIKTSTTVNNVQDFRIRDLIDVFIANLNIVNSIQNIFPEQSDILLQNISKKSYFSQLFLTKDADKNMRYCFSFDYGAYVLENIQFSALVKSMTAEGKKRIIDNSEILNLTVSRTQVQNQPSRNHLGSPIQNRVASDGTIKTPLVAGSLGGDNLTEISLILSEQPDTPDSIIRNFTGIDELMKETEDGAFQYSVDVEINDGFVPVMREVFANLSSAIASYNNYVALTNIPGVYDERSRKFTVIGAQIMNSFDPDAAGADPPRPTLTDIINTYLSTLDLFVEIDRPLATVVPQSTNETIRRILQNNIGRNISPNNGSVDGIILFQEILNNLLAQMNNVLSVGSNSVGVEATTTNRQADSISSFKDRTIKTSEVFESTIDARFLNESYINNISANFGTFNGLNIYTGEDLATATRTEVTPINLFLSQQEALEKKGVVFDLLPSSTSIAAKNVSSTKFLGKESGGATKNLNSQNLNPQDLDISKIKKMIPESAFSAFDPNAQSFAKSVLTENQLKTQVDVLVGFTVRGVATTAQYQQTIVNTYMIKGAQFETKQLGELTSATQGRFFLCKQTRRSDLEVVDCFFLVPPVSTTFDTAAEIVLTSPGQFLETETTETLADTAVDLLISGEQLANPTTPGPVASAASIGIGTLLQGGVDRDFVLPEDNRARLPTQADRFLQESQGTIVMQQEEATATFERQQNNIQTNLSGLTPQNIVYSGE